MANVAQAILSQMGGMEPLKAMLGAHTFVNHGDALSFKFKAGLKHNYCKIKLDAGADLYDVEISKITKRSFNYMFNHPDADTISISNKKTLDGAYCDMLQEFFESTTGLYLSL